MNALRPVRKSHEFKFSLYTETDITVDPLIVLRCDERVFRLVYVYLFACSVISPLQVYIREGAIGLTSVCPSVCLVKSGS